MACNQPATHILRAVSDYLYEYSESPQHLGEISDSIMSLSDAIYKVKASYVHNPHSPAEFAEKLMHSIDWRELESFMDMKQRQKPYPKILFRAHMHGELFPRFIDDFTENYCDTFGSDLHLYQEWEEFCELRVSVYDLEDELPTIQDLSGEISQHLQKTQINKGRTPLDTNYYISPFLSLSADFRWTLHRSFEKHQIATDSQQSGLAIFDTSKMHEIKVRVWRVSDLLLFLDSKPRFKGSIISELSRKWAHNADEYLCLDFIPKEALLNFVPCNQMVNTEQEPYKMFLRPFFRESKNLAHFKTFGMEKLSVDDYHHLLSSFLESLLDHVSPSINGEPLVDHLIDQLADYRQWGYDLATNRLSLRQKLGRLVNREYAFGLESWVWDPNCARPWKEICWNFSEIYHERAESMIVEGF
ncbi:hypothetical protein BDV38DRAFT_48213 [Aspergillus pseudotamarii]|uniref:DUF7587 domain-containing protein n=1 Tax=Aspergillus pseudotamarii TaxID=132259 RepID=A0A5N6S9V0_ASPPS|nr:uncharacterized protein BDV38DRAFT_48213 [Aspergillus pseudotamarii]KAE8130757.1 hypothetical protein BDV38DRAFT_48213 [Aspergillus pseudotamarii]